VLKALPGVQQVESISTVSFRLQTADVAAVRKQIYELALQQGCDIVSLQSGNQSLEDVFRNLTR